MPTQPLRLPFYVGISPTLNIRGLIAGEPLKKGDLIETCPIVLIRKKETPALKRTVLKKYYCEWDADYHCVALGYGSLINHSYRPNARYTHDYDSRTLVIRAIRGIDPDEEITMNYNYHPGSKKPLKAHYLDFNKHMPEE